jgi:hypothetical protein
MDEAFHSPTTNSSDTSTFSLSLSKLSFPNDQAQIHPHTKELWFFQGSQLNRYANGVIIPVHKFHDQQPGRLIFFTKKGNILTSQEETGEVMLSRDGGETFQSVLRLSTPNSWAMNWGVEEVDNIILLGEYHLGLQPAANVYISLNDGKTWEKYIEFKHQRHLHFIKKDPYSNQVYLTTGDDSKDVLISDISSLQFRMLYEDSQLMSVGFTEDYIALGSDKECGNFILLQYRNGKTVRNDLTSPRDLMVYDFAFIPPTLISTNRLSHNIDIKIREQNYNCLWSVELNKAIAEQESFYLSNVVDSVAYTGRTEQTLKITRR